MKKQANSFYNAFKGIFNCILSEGHFRFELIAAVYVIYFSLRFYSLTSTQWAILTITICIVLISEAFNTAIEKTCDRITKEYDKTIKMIKDISAGAVLIVAIMAIAIAFFILFDVKVLLSIYEFYTTHIFNLLILMLTAIVSVAFIVINPKKKVEDKHESE